MKCQNATVAKTNKRTEVYVYLMCMRTYTCMCNYCVKAIPLQAWTGPEGFRMRLPDFKKKGHMKVVRLSALRTGCLYPTGNIPGLHFC